MNRCIVLAIDKVNRCKRCDGFADAGEDEDVFWMMVLLVGLDICGRLERQSYFPHWLRHKSKITLAIETCESLQSSQATMDAPLRCNSLKCRQRLADRAVVTTCRLVMRCLPKPDI